MAPFHFEGILFVLVTLAIGFSFGFVLERAGFGNANNLAAQFYLHDLRVLKVMFTAILTAMVLLFAGIAIGWVNFAEIWVAPTRLGPAVVGGLLLGVGFIVGGYCPGTSLVSASTWKIDGLLFAFGVAFGLLVFAMAVPSFWQFWNFSGEMGRVTLFDFLGLDAGVVVVGVVVMALGAFGVAELSERIFGARRSTETEPSGTAGREGMPRFVGAGVLLLIGVTAAIIGQPTTARELEWNRVEIEGRLVDREPFIDPAEVLGMMYNNQIEPVFLDLRLETDYNEFHLMDARRISLAELDAGWGKGVSADKIVVVMSNDEQTASEAWKRLAVYPNANAYILAGGVNRWLALYKDGQPNVPGPEHATLGDDSLRHHFSEALGARHSESRPGKENLPLRKFQPKVKVRKPTRSEGGGCG